MILNALEGLLTKPVAKSTDTVTFCIKLLKNSPTFHDYLVYRYVSV
jgi:DNA-directed RNA polymerase subunit H (RpoH/RPB5)